MSNMSYCRFQNTSSDLQDCLGALGDMDPEDIQALHEKNNQGALSKDEAAAFRRLFRTCVEIVEEFGPEV